MIISSAKSIFRYFSIVIALALPFNAGFAAFVHDQSLEWQTLETNHFNIHFHDGAKQIALKTANISENLLKELQPTINWIPDKKIDIIISDEVDYSNGYVMPFLPGPRMTLFVNPPDQLSEYQDWFYYLIKHELVHSLHLGKASGHHG